MIQPGFYRNDTGKKGERDGAATVILQASIRLLAPRMKREDLYSVALRKGYCGGAEKRGAEGARTRPPCPGSQREARAGQSMPGSEEPEESKSCQHCIIHEVERRGKRGEGGGELVRQDGAATQSN